MFFIKLLSLIPLKILYLISDVLAPIMAKFYRKNVVLENIRKCLPNKTEKERKMIGKKFYRGFCDAIFENIAFTQIDKKFLLNHVKADDAFLCEVIEKVKSGNSVFLMCGHIFNWEWSSRYFNAYSEKIKMDFVYLPLSNSKIENYLNLQRTKFGGKAINTDDVMKYVLRSKEAKCIGFVYDQLPLVYGKKYWINFLGTETAFYVGVDKLAQVKKADVYYVNILKEKRGYYKVKGQLIYTPNSPDFQKKNTIKTYVNCLENNIKQQPEIWMWSHKRWKYKNKKNPTKDIEIE